MPDESKHPRAGDVYVKFTFAKILSLKHPVKNVIPRRVSFGFTDLQSLRRAKDILELYHVPKTEQLVADALRALGIETTAEVTVVDPKSKLRVRIDLVIECKKGKIAIECDNDKAHKSKIQKKRDRAKDNLLKHLGWDVMRFSEEEILSNLNSIVDKVEISRLNLLKDKNL